MTGWRGTVLAGALLPLLLGAACTDEPGSAAVDEAVDALAEEPADSTAFATAVEAVADDGADPDAAAVVADALPQHLDGLVELDRPDVVRAFEALLEDDQARDRTLGTLSEWLVSQVDPLVDGTADEGETDDRLRAEVAPVLAAARSGAERGDALSGGEMIRTVTGAARQELALQVAERDGLGPLEPGDYARTLSDAWDTGDPVEALEMAISDEVASHGDDDAW